MSYSPYGYDTFVLDEPFDESFYIETANSLGNQGEFNNRVETLISGGEESLISCACSELKKKCTKYQYALKNKVDEINLLKNQVFVFYILLFAAVFIILFQRMNNNNLQQLIYILKLNSQFSPMKLS